MSGTRKILLGAGITLLIVGVGGAGMTYQDIRRENLLHAVAATVPVPTTDTASTATAGFLPYSDGGYSLYITSTGRPEGTRPSPGAGTNGCPPDSLLTVLSEYGGSVMITVSDPDGRIIYNHRITPGDVRAAVPTGRGWVPVDTLRVPAGERQWSLTVSVDPGVSHPPGCGMEISILPPQRLDIGSYMESGIMRLVGFGACMMAGFVVIVLSGRRGR